MQPDDNRALLRLIRDARPESVTRVAELSGGALGNLSRTLTTMKRYGLVELHRRARHVRPVAKASRFLIRAA